MRAVCSPCSLRTAVRTPHPQYQDMWCFLDQFWSDSVQSPLIPDCFIEILNISLERRDEKNDETVDVFVWSFSFQLYFIGLCLPQSITFLIILSIFYWRLVYSLVFVINMISYCGVWMYVCVFPHRQMVCEYRKGQLIECMENTLWSQHIPGRDNRLLLSLYNLIKYVSYKTAALNVLLQL